MSYRNLRPIFAYNGFFQGREEEGEISDWERTWRDSVLDYFDRPAMVPVDKSGPLSSRSSDEHIEDLALSGDYDLFVSINHIGRGWEREFVARETMERVHNLVPVIAIWGDLQLPEQRRYLEKLRPNIDLHISTASWAVAQRLERKCNIIHRWVPILEPSVPSCQCGRMVSFAGSLTGSRRRVLDHLGKHGLDICVPSQGGGRSLSRLDYLRTLSHPATISFNNSGPESVINARVFEALHQGSVLLQQRSREVARVLRDRSEAFFWQSSSDLYELIQLIQESPSVLENPRSRCRAISEALTNDRMWTESINQLRGQRPLQDFVKEVYFAEGFFLDSAKNRVMQAPGAEASISFLQLIRSVFGRGLHLLFRGARITFRSAVRHILDPLYEALLRKRASNDENTIPR